MGDTTVRRPMVLQLACEGLDTPLSLRRLSGVEEVGEPSRFELEVLHPQPLDDPASLVGKACALLVDGPLGRRVTHGVVRAIRCLVSAAPNGARRYRIAMSSPLAQLELRRDSRVFQHLTGPQIARTLIEEAGAGTPTEQLAGEHPPIRYRTQYDESSLTFLRRVCEQQGFWYRHEPGDGVDEVVLADDASGAPPSALDGPLLVTEQAGLIGERPRAWDLEVSEERRPGRVEIAGYNFRKPAVAVTADVREGEPADHERRIFAVAPDAASPEDAQRIGTVALQAARATGRRVRLSTSGYVLLPGHQFELELPPSHDGPEPPTSLFCVRVAHEWEQDGDYHCRVDATPTEVPFRLEQRTAPPTIKGVQSAIVTGPEGEEIHADEDGCVRVRFHWDRTGPTDGESSLPVRVVHPNLEGSMLLPRIGWEVWVAFENGDPDRPFVLGRAYNGRHGPPVALPANKTMTMLSTSSSPGAGRTNSISYDDAAGKQGLNMNAGKGLTKSVGNNVAAQTMADERTSIKGSRTLTVGGNQEEGVKYPRIVDSKLLNITVAGNQTLKTPAAIHFKVGSETVTCSTLMEQVGSPGGALGALAFQAAMTVGGLIPLPGGWDTAKGIALGAVGTAKAAHDAYKKDGATGAATEVAKGVMGLLPGGDLVGDALDVLESGNHAPWQGDEKEKKEQEGVGNQQDNTVGGGPAAGAGAAEDGGGGNRVHEVSGPFNELIGGAYSIATGGQSKWTTLGASSITVGGPHATAAGKVSWLHGGASAHTTGAYTVTAARGLSRQVRVMQLSAASLTMKATSGIQLKGSSINLTCGALKINGKLVLEAKGTKVTIDGSGLTVEGATVDFNGPVMCKQSDRS